MILRGLPGPFLAAFGTLVFVLLLQFLIVNLGNLVGRGLPVRVILELVTYSLAYMVSLAIPMSFLLALLVVFGRLAETEAYAVAKSAGIALPRLTWPVLVVGMGLVGGMAWFNSVALPEANHRMRSLWQDIRTARPGFALEAGAFYDGLDGYALRVDDIEPETAALDGVLIFDHSTTGEEATITAARGALRASLDGAVLEMVLEDGEIHRSGAIQDAYGRHPRYEHIAFSRHRLRLDASELSFERQSPDETSRTGRTMRTGQMVAMVDSLERSKQQRRGQLRGRLDRLVSINDSESFAVGDTTLAPPLPHAEPLLDGLPLNEQQLVLDLATQRARAVRAEIDAALANLRWEHQRANRFRVEIHKKFSMALACLVFAFFGIPLGLSVRRRGYGWAIVLAVGLFLVYWTLLVQGEKFADRGFFPPWVGMWAPNAVGATIALTVYLREMLDPAGRDALRRLIGRWRRPTSR